MEYASIIDNKALNLKFEENWITDNISDNVSVWDVR